MSTPATPVSVSRISLASCYAVAKREGQAIGTLSCFLYRCGGEDFVVSAWHNFSGRRPDNHRLLGRAIPNELEISLPLRGDFIDGQAVVFTVEVGVNLYPSHLAGRPIWFVHPQCGHAIDVAAISVRSLFELGCSVQFLEGRWETPTKGLVDLIGGTKFVEIHPEVPHLVRYEPINEVARSDLPSSVGDDVFIVGFPRSIRPTGNFPIWKKGSIATEPTIDANLYPLLLVDSMPREGLSGAPVVQLRPTGAVPMRGGTLRLMSGEAPKFLGVYSGRDHGKESEAQLGRVWKSSAVHEICSGGRRGVSSAQEAQLPGEVGPYVG